MRRHPDGNVEEFVRNTIANVLKYQPAPVVLIEDEPKREKPTKLERAIAGLGEDELEELRRRIS